MNIFLYIECRCRNREQRRAGTGCKKPFSGPFGCLTAVFFCLFFLAGPPAVAQTRQTEKHIHPGGREQPAKGYTIGYKIENNDTVYVDKINPVYVYNRPDGRKKNKQWREYYKLIYNFKKTYPYALKAKEIAREADSVMAVSGFSHREKEKYLRQYERRLFREFDKPLRNLTFSQGKLLLKLIDRELGQTSYYIIKNYRGGAAAGFWQGIAKLFGSDLKKPYDKFGEDKLTEELVIMYHRGTFDYLYYSLYVR